MNKFIFTAVLSVFACSAFADEGKFVESKAQINSAIQSCNYITIENRPNDKWDASGYDQLYVTKTPDQQREVAIREVNLAFEKNDPTSIYKNGDRCTITIIYVE